MPSLLSTNYKLEKLSDGRIDFAVKGLAMAPHSLGNNRNVCSQATDACREACVLWFTGRTVMPTVRNAMIARKNRFFENREQFYSDLRKEIDSFCKTCKRKSIRPAIRLNVASDIDHSRFILDYCENSDFGFWPTFYDYTKVFNRALRSVDRVNSWPINYHLTYSFSERSTQQQIESILFEGGNVAIVFDTEYNPRSGKIGEFPEYCYIGNKLVHIVDGDKQDIRCPELDGHCNIIGLRFKGSKAKKQAAIESGFCQQLGRLSDPIAKIRFCR